MSLLNPCSGCKAPCCRDYLITLTSFDVSRIAGNTGKKPEEFAILSTANLLNLNESTILECHEKNERYDYLLSLKSHPCIFLKENNCSIHRFAPYICRSYPRTSEGNLLGRARCNIIQKAGFKLAGVSISKEEYSKQMTEYVELVKEWNKKKGTKEECWEFLFRR
ncbi:MAG: YkgJ family cysteine cluster protein [bacterium]|nr:YkgJ family cysteine cluster protein [bacterium]